MLQAEYPPVHPATELTEDLAAAEAAHPDKSHSAASGEVPEERAVSVLSAPEYDFVTASGSVNLDGAHLNLALGFNPTLGQIFRIIDNTGGSAVSGTFTGLPEGATYIAGGVTLQISYSGGSGNDVTLEVVSLQASCLVSRIPADS